MNPGEKGETLVLPSQLAAVTRGAEAGRQVAVADAEDQEKGKPGSDLDYLSELLAMHNNGPKNIGFFGTRNMGFLHQQVRPSVRTHIYI